MTQFLQSLMRLWFRPIRAAPNARPLPDLGTLPTALRRDLNLPSVENPDPFSAVNASGFFR